MSDSVNGKQYIIPTWLNDKFLETALRSGEGDDDLVVNSSEITRATAPGDHYMSVMYRAKVQISKAGESKKMSLIIKSEHTGGKMEEMSRKFEIFELEVTALRDVIPAMHRILDEANCVQYSPFAAKFIYAHFGAPASAIVLEDLKESSFELAERKAGLDFDHCKLVMETLAKFHAASIVLSIKHPEIIEPFVEPATKNMLDSEFTSFLSTFLTELSKKLKNSSDVLQRYSEKILKIAENGMERWTNGRKRNEKEFNVLAHGDLWVNNMMFHYTKDRKVDDVRFLDYQLTYWSSPATDLQYFLNSSPSSDVLEDQQKFVEIYHRTLGETLTKLGYKKLHPSLDKINEQMESRGEFAVICVLAMRNSVLVEDENIMEVEKIINQEQKVNFGQLYLNSLEKQLPMLEKKGWL